MSTVGFQPDGFDAGGNARKLSQAECDRLHFLKNMPIQPTIDGLPIQFAPYVYTPFPAAMYGKWTDETKRVAMMALAPTLGLNLSNPTDRQEVEARMAPYDTRKVHSEDERRAWADRGWADSPADVKAAEDRVYDRQARAAAEQAHDDKNMGSKAKAEFHAADVANGEEHLVGYSGKKR